MENKNKKLHLIGSELLESKNRYRNLFDKSPVSLWEEDYSLAKELLLKKKAEVKDLKKYLNENPDFLKECIFKIKIIRVNHNTLELFGVKNKEELLIRLRKTLNYEATEILKKELLAIVSDKSEFSDEAKFTRKDGTEISTILKFTKINNEGKVIVSLTDITALKKSEQILLLAKKKIEKSEKKFRELFEKSGDAILIIVNGIFIDCNKAATKMLNYKSKEEFLNSHPSELSPEFQSDGLKSKEKAEEMMALAVSKGTHRFEWMHTKSDGKIFPVEVLLTSISNEPDNKIIHVVWRDITERKEEEKALMQFSYVLSSTTDMMALLDSNFIYQLANESYCKGLNITSQQLIGKTQVEIFGDEFFKKNILPNATRCIEERVRVNYQDWFDLPFLGKKFMDINYYPYYGNGKKVIGFVVNARDITEKKKAELEIQKKNKELLLAKEKVEESNSLKTEFLNNMSHEIRTPMNGILGFSEMLSQKDLTDEKRANFIRLIQSSGQQLLNVIDDILEISRLGTKQVKVIETIVCLNDLLLELFAVFDIKAKENNTPLYLKKELSDKQSTILIDKTKLNKVISNLLENALKFTAQGFIEFGYRLKNSKIEIYVKDTGIGIEQKKHEAIFERFSQAEKDISKKVGGLGLGLSIAKENTELLGGNIRLTSKKGEGATFFVTIPYKPVYKDNETDKEGADIQHKYTILIAEDEEVNYLYLDALLKDVIGLDCKIIHVINGQQAVEACKKNKTIDLVLMDLKMPVMNGFEATQHIKKIFPNIPIIAQTAYSTIKEQKRATLMGCNDFISKPIHQENLREMLKKYSITNMDS